MKTASWVIKEVKTGSVICETFSEIIVRNLRPEYVAIPIQDHLVQLNNEIKNA